MHSHLSFRHLTDAALEKELHRVAVCERQIVARFVALLAEFDRRRLHLALGYRSLFEYCVKELKLTEHETCNRIDAARAVQKYPSLLPKLARGEMSLTAIRLLRPHLTTANAEGVIAQATGKNVEGVKLVIARLNPQPPVPSVIRKLPEQTVSAASTVTTAAANSDEPPVPLSEVLRPSEPPASRRPIVAPLSGTHYKLQLTISAAARERLREIQGLMRHRLPNGDPAAIVERALEVLYEQLLKDKAAIVAKPRLGKTAVDPKGRYVPASIRREVYRRDQGRCAFVGSGGMKCGSTDGVEFHHVQPYAVGGDASATNIELRCRAHNGFEWTQHLDQETLALAEPTDSGPW